MVRTKALRIALAMTCLTTASLLSGCMKRMTVHDYVLSKIPLDHPGFRAALEAADAGQTAFNKNADTPIMEIRDNKQTNDELVAVFAKARDEYRKATSYRIAGYSSSLQPLKDKVVLTDIESTRSERVSIPLSMDRLGLRVQANRARVDILYVESARGLPVLRFDSSMNPTVTRDFYPYLVGDKVDVGGDIKQTIRRPSAGE